MTTPEIRARASHSDASAGARVTSIFDRGAPSRDEVGTPDNCPARGRVSLVGAGPGDPELITVKAWRRLQAADVVLYDALVNPDMLSMCRPQARCVHVGKRAGGRGWKQEDITALMLSEAQAGHRVVRLKGGDPFVFGRGGEEAMALAEAGIEVEVVPGITSAVAVPSAAGIPVTHRGVSTHFTVVTGHSARDTETLRARWQHLAKAGGTLVFLMPTRNLERIVDAVREAGVPLTRPAALIARGTREEQHIIEAPLGEIVARVRSEGAVTPATFVVGDVVGLRHAILGTSDVRASGTDENVAVTAAI